MRKLSILGSTGSIGTQALQLVDLHPENYKICALSAHHQAEALFEQVRKYRPQLAALTAGEVPIPEDLRFCDWYFGESALVTLAEKAPQGDVLVSVVGMVGLEAVLAARKAGKRVLLANKEALVAGGALVMDLCREEEGIPTLLPVDSEHSAIFQCLQSAKNLPFSSIQLTASGGPFREWDAQRIKNASLEDALKHPNWVMGRKITIDSASMFNKALEMLEAYWLFGAKPEQIEVLIHPQSIIHSMVTFQDGASLAQLGVPDMRAAIGYALSFPKRLETGVQPLSLSHLGTLTFEAPDEKRFPALRLARECLNAGGASGCVMNAANEVAVAAFLNKKIIFGQIPELVEACLSKFGNLPARTLEDILYADALAREHTQACVAS